MEEEQVKKQFILNEEKELTEIPKSLCAAVKYPIKCKLKNAFEVFVRDQGEWEKVYTGTVIGYKKIIPLFKENVKEIRIVLNDYRVLPQISFVGVYPRKK